MACKNEPYDSLMKIAKARKSWRSFAEAAVSEEEIQKIINLATLSPYASGRKNWKIKAVNDPEIIAQAAEVVNRRCVLLSADVRCDMQEAFKSYAENFVVFKKAPVLLYTEFRVAPALSLMIENNESIKAWERDNFVKSIAGVTMMVLLAAEALDLAACCMTGPLLAQDELAALFNIKETKEIGAIIALGHKPKEKADDGK
ncbi:MAG: nitroreductase family protein [Candidatus Rifleibacteriota bacterium]